MNYTEKKGGREKRTEAEEAKRSKEKEIGEGKGARKKGKIEEKTCKACNKHFCPYHKSFSGGHECPGLVDNLQ